MLPSFGVSMFFGCWNVRGSVDPMKQREVRHWIREHKLVFCGLVETKVKIANKEVVLQNISRG